MEDDKTDDGAAKQRVTIVCHDEDADNADDYDNDDDDRKVGERWEEMESGWGYKALLTEEELN